ncbi:dienelactone hydrolase family protein [Psychroflexus aestuariivivens]|uniref:dienelactone hydrolase family protein n=1 Tax=Psychroflexus aestuariivivens TaxID=1795040 RepID=UPI000FD8DC7B|nr:dienelactone hydrolase family protein [Psychroflexus aestuariivivens]
MYTKFKLLLLSIILVGVSCKNETKKPSEENENQTEEQINLKEEKKSKFEGREVTYETDSTIMRGYVAYDEINEEKRPGILVVHEWWGHDDYARKRADDLAKLGYVALAVDMYGNGKQVNHPKEAMKFSSNVMQNFDVAKVRFNAAMELLKSHKYVDDNKISAVGFCFGGSVALAMANSGSDLDAVAAFHSGIELPVMPNEDLKARILVQNGAEDAMITDEQEEKFKSALEKINADYTYLTYEGVKHSFTNKAADSIAKKHDLPLAYDKEATEESWNRMIDFFNETYSE